MNKIQNPTELSKTKSCRKLTLFKKVKALSKLCDVKVALVVKDSNRVDAYFSNENIETRLKDNLSYFMSQPVVIFYF